jgi:uncharacterized membrane protein
MQRNALTARITRGVLACAIVVGSLAFWTVVPIGWLYLTGDLVSQAGGRFLMAIFGVPVMMALAFMILSRVEAYRNELRPAHTSREGTSLLEVALVGSALVAVVALIVWWAFIADAADPSGPLQPI